MAVQRSGGLRPRQATQKVERLVELAAVLQQDLQAPLRLAGRLRHRQRVLEVARRAADLRAAPDTLKVG